MEFDKNLNRLRKEKGWSQEELGNRLNVSRQTVSKWELGTTAPEMNKLIELSRLFEISMDELTGNVAASREKEIVYVTVNQHYEYKSKTTVFGIPLVHINFGRGMYRAKGIIAAGNFAVGLLSAGIFSAGLLSLGMVSLGLFAFAGLALGGMAVGGAAFGIFAVGGLAVGVYAVGGCAVAARIAVGGYASAHIAIGGAADGAFTFTEKGPDVSNEIRKTILREYPHTWKFLVRLFAASMKSL
ncbi:helix-turn-helix domain-containing protein [Anaerostipes sp.]|uniref:helix-turn-helix domain-containing protein n=1 Tax=Anaerostipes sp. TaxID=1872530 RepID=UPI0025C65CEC|nr:helix-turn-helix domain-containing protein [Anaerostipes sp.]MBS7008344.1 helix-turn-helix domain-containing protein [Anaerostipes sp.]